MSDEPRKGSSKPGTIQPGEVRNPTGRPKLSEAEREARALVAEFSPEAVQRLIEFARGKDKKLALDALKHLTPWLSKFELEVKSDGSTRLALFTDEQILLLATGG